LNHGLPGLVNIQKAIENGTFIVDFPNFPIKNVKFSIPEGNGAKTKHYGDLGGIYPPSKSFFGPNEAWKTRLP
jgi:hypothetical protein